MQFLLNQCHILVNQHGSVMLTLFLAGLIGGLSHCAGMCGPFVMSQLSSPHTPPSTATHLSTLQRLKGAALLPYHLGRMTTYMGLGMLAALLSRQIMGTPLQQWVSAVLLTLAGIIFILSALPRLRHYLTRLRHHDGSRFGRLLHYAAKPWLGNPSGLRGYILGIILGFLPCGLVFAALMVVATTGAPFTAALAMALFTLGTFPALLMVGLGGQWLYRNWPGTMQLATRCIMVINGCSLCILAGSLVI